MLHVVTRMNVGGVASLVLNLTAGLPAHGVEVLLATGAVQDGEVEVAPLPHACVRLPGLGRAPRVTDDIHSLRAMRQVINAFRPDVVHTHTAKAGVLGRLATEGVAARRVHTFHGHLLHGYFGASATRAVTLTERALASRTDLLISSGARVGDELRAAGVGRRRPWETIAPGVVPPSVSGTPTGRTVAFVGRLVRIKRPDRLIEVARLLPDVHFLIAGDGPLRPWLESQATPNVEFLGWVQDVGAVYGRASLVLLCSDNEAMPLTLIEGALCGLPAVTSDVGSAAEVVEHGVTGHVVSSSPRALADAVATILNDEELRRRMGADARRRAEDRYTVAAMCEAHAHAYQRL